MASGRFVTPAENVLLFRARGVDTTHLGIAMAAPLSPDWTRTENDAYRSGLSGQNLSYEFGSR